MAISGSRPQHLISKNPTASAPADVAIGHVQLRDLVVCPVERGVVWYVSGRSIVEQDIISSDPERKLVLLSFTPVTLTALPLSSPPGKQLILLAAGGQDAELFLGLYSYTPRRCRNLKHKARYGHRDSVSSSASDATMVGSMENSEGKHDEDCPAYSVPIWQHASALVGSINNNVMLYIPPKQHRDPSFDSMDDSTPRLVVSNNDCTVKFFDVCLSKRGLRRSPPNEPIGQMISARYWRRLAGRDTAPGSWSEGWGMRGTSRVGRYERVGCLRLPVPVNHTSISPDGSTLISCGDASTIFVHRIMPQRDGNSLLFEQLAKYEIPLPSPSSQPAPPSPSSSSINSPEMQSPYPPYAFVDGMWVYAAQYSSLNRYGIGVAPPACFTTAWSSDGSKFAAASQDGVVRVWDVRSGEPLPYGKWETGRDRSELEFKSAGSGRRRMDDVQWYEQMGGAPPWGVRSLKFARNASGREVLAYTEHTSFVHVIDANTFERHEALRIPYVQPGKPRAERQRRHSRSRPAGQYPPYETSLSGPLEQDPAGLGRFRDLFNESTTPQAATGGDLHHERTSPADGTNSDARRIFRLPRRRLERLPPPPPAASNEEQLDAEDPIRLSMNVDIVNSVGADSDDETEPEENESTASADAHLEPSRVLDPTHALTASPAVLPIQFPRMGSTSELDAADRREEMTADDWTNFEAVFMGASDMDQAQARAALLHLMRTRNLQIRVIPNVGMNHDQMEADIAFHEREETRRRLERNSSARSTPTTVTDGTEDGDAIVIPPLHDLRSEEDVRTVLAAHGIAAVTSSSTTRDPNAPGESSYRSAENTNLPSSHQAYSPTIPLSLSRLPTPPSTSPLGWRPLYPSEPVVVPGSPIVLPTIPSPPAASPPQTPFPVPEETIPSSPPSPFLPTADRTPTPVASPRRRGSDSSLSSISSSELAPSDSASHGDVVPPSRARQRARVRARALAEAQARGEERDAIEAEETQGRAQAQTQSGTVDATSTGAVPAQPQSQSQAQALPPCRELIESTERLDIAGVCFDPAGAYMYVATADGITEWAVQGIEKRWWGGGAYV